MNYDRCATTIEEQVDILESRGLIIEDRPFAISSLRKIGYFRFKGYCLPYYKSKDKFMEEDYIDIDKIGFPENWQEYLS